MSPEMSFAERAALSLMLEVSSTPKAGNVDREHDHIDLKFQHFLVSALASVRVFSDVERGGSIGEGIYRAVKRSVGLCGRNVHFGAFLLLIPLVKASVVESMESGCNDDGSGISTTAAASTASRAPDPEMELMKSPNAKREKVAGRALDILKKTGVEDSVLVLRAFRESRARVADVSAGDLRGVDENWLRKRGISLYRWMEMGRHENVIAEELVSGYRLSLEGADVMERELESGNLNDAVVYTYHYLLSRCIDPLVKAKFGYEVAEEVREMAKEAVSSRDFDSLDRTLISRGINPGSVADLAASSIYLLTVDRLELVLERI